MPPHCTIIPPHLLRSIASSEAASQEVRDRCVFTLEHNQHLWRSHLDSVSSEAAGSARIPTPRFNIPPNVQDTIAGRTEQQSSAAGEFEQPEATPTDAVTTDSAHAIDGGLADATCWFKKSKLNRAVYTANGKAALPGKLIRSEGQPDTGSSDASGDPDECYNGFKSTYDFYEKVFHRVSIDDRGMKLIGTVHYLKKYNNAFWDGRQMVYGDGDGKVFNGFTDELDVIGHELTHGVTERTAALTYEGQSGALNESISDCFGSMVKQYKLGHTSANADWLIGEGIFTKSVNGKALRSMKAPGSAYDDPKVGKDPQPGTMAGYVDTNMDNGGVHINSGIPNHAFYLIAVALGGNSWDRAGNIWYKALTGGELDADADFEAFATLTVKNALELYGEEVAAVVAKGWHAVGVKTTKSAAAAGHASE